MSNEAVSKPVVLIAEELSPATVDALGPDFDVRDVDGADRSALLAALPSASAVLVRSATKMDAEAIAAAPLLKVIARAGVGLDNVDIKAATAAGVMVVNAPTSNIISAAELTVGHILSLARHIPAAHGALAEGQWKRSKYTGIELYEKTVGIIGLGRIGALITSRLQAFGVNVIAYDPYITSARAQQLGVTPVSLDELLEQSDFITIHIFPFWNGIPVASGVALEAALEQDVADGVRPWLVVASAGTVDTALVARDDVDLEKLAALGIEPSWARR